MRCFFKHIDMEVYCKSFIETLLIYTLIKNGTYWTEEETSIQRGNYYAIIIADALHTIQSKHL